MSCMKQLDSNSKMSFNDPCLLGFYSYVASTHTISRVATDSGLWWKWQVSLLRVTQKWLCLPYGVATLLTHSGGTKLLCFEVPCFCHTSFHPASRAKKVSPGPGEALRCCGQLLANGSAKVPCSPRARDQSHSRTPELRNSQEDMCLLFYAYALFWWFIPQKF